MTNKRDNMGRIKAGMLAILTFISLTLVGAGAHTREVSSAAGTTSYPYPTLVLNLTPQTPVSPVNLSASHSAAPLYAGDMAWNKPAFASTYWQTYYPARVTDGLTDPPEQWISASSTGTWFYVDLGTPQTIHQITTTLYVDINFTAAPHTYYITSNDLMTWQIVKDEINYSNSPSRNQRTFTLPQDVTGRYVGLYAADWGGGWGDMTLFAVLPSTSNFTPVSYNFLPLIRLQPPGIYGYVTENGVPAIGVTLELRFWNGMSWSTRATTTTAPDGLYTFTNAPSLSPGQYYYVRYLNTTTATRLYTWHTQTLRTYYTGASDYIGNFDIANVALVVPAPGAIVPLPTTFRWSPRPATASDSYEFDLFDPNTGDPYFFTDPPLGYVGSYILGGLPPGFRTGTAYVWNIWVYSPDGGYGISYYAYYVMFSTTAGQATAEGLRRSIETKDLPPSKTYHRMLIPDGW